MRIKSSLLTMPAHDYCDLRHSLRDDGAGRQAVKGPRRRRPSLAINAVDDDIMTSRRRRRRRSLVQQRVGHLRDGQQRTAVL